jgi:hypothetical protein
MAFYVGDPSAPTRFGTDMRDTTDDTGLFLKVFGGEVFAAFERNTVTLDRHFVKEIASGKSAQFPLTWRVNTEYVDPGQEMLGQDTEETENVITVDKLLVSHIGISDIDEAMSHFDIRQRYTRELGLAIGRTFDKNVMRSIILTSRNTDANGVNWSVPTGSSFPAGDETTSAEVSGTLTATDGDQWWEAVRQMRIRMATNDVPENDPLYVVLPPAGFDALKWASVSNNFVLASRDFQGLGGAGNQDGVINVEGIQVMRSNLIPQTNESSDTSVFSKYRGDYSGVLGVGWHGDAVGTTKLIGMGVEMTRDTRRNEDFVVARMAAGHGPLRNVGATSFIATAVGV